MPYATEADMVAAYGATEVVQLTDRDLDGEIDTAVLVAALETASLEIDGYLAPRYALPLSPVPRLLTVWCCTIARYHLTSSSSSETDPIRARYRDTVRSLEAVRDAKLSIGVGPTGAPVDAGDSVRFDGGQKVFGRDQRVY